MLSSPHLVPEGHVTSPPFVVPRNVMDGCIGGADVYTHTLVLGIDSDCILYNSITQGYCVSEHLGGLGMEAIPSLFGLLRNRGTDDQGYGIMQKL